ncbi:MAG: M48 family metalloprotease [Muribaculaceae bacterium]|nr:M48 family metalloprotease [Muribaculaceae bacterium]
MDRTTKITGLSILVLAQVVLFVIVYLATIAMGAGLVYLAFHASVWIIPPFFENVAPDILRLGKAGVLLLLGIVVGIVGLWAFIIAVGVYLIKPLFIFPKRDKNYGKEIHREDSPKLYDMIMDTAKAVGVRKPKHIYVNHEVNACVFFNTGFWNIFFPVRKNLIIGLGLFESTNSEEVKSIIAHEFGHFAQGSMRVGSVLYIANKVITNLAYRRDKLDTLMLQWCLKSGVWGFWGKATQAVVIKFRGLVDYMYRSQQRNYMKLSRQMEYDADAVACRIVGTETFVSGLCKVQQLSKSFDFYNHVLGNLANQQQTVSDYWKGYELTKPNMCELKIKLSAYDNVETTPELEKAKSRVSVEEIWDSHPTVENRIEHAKSLGIIKTDKEPTISAWDMVESALKAEVSATLLQQLKESNPSVSIVDWKEYTEILAKKIEFSYFPKEIEVFFERYIITEPENTSDENNENPLTDDNRIAIMEYEQALKDRYLLSLLDKGNTAVKHFIYNGTDYSTDNVPVSEHDRYIADLKRKAERIDAAIKNYAMSKADNCSLIVAAYEAIAYSQSVTTSIENDFLPVREDMLQELGKANIAGEEDFNSLRSWLNSYERALKEVLKSLKYRQIIPFMSKKEHADIITFLDAGGSFITGIDRNCINRMFVITDWIMRVHNHLAHSAKMVIANVILGKELPNIDFLKLWFKSEDENSPHSDDKEEHVSIDSLCGTLNVPIPTDEEVETIYYPEWFRYRLWEKFENLKKDQEFDYSMVATIPLKEENGELTYSNPEDKEKFLVEIQEYYHFLETHQPDTDWIKTLNEAKQGNGYANSLMAALHLYQNQHNRALEFAMRGAIAGDDYGVVLIGILKDTEQERDSGLTIKLFKFAAARGEIYALHNLGLRYADGNGVEQDEAKALRLFERAALQGYAEAQNNAGYMYINGIGTKVNLQKGLYWLTKAVKNGSKKSINSIWQYYKWAGDTEQYIKALQWGAANEVEECVAELDRLNMLNTQSETHVSNYEGVVENPKPVYDTETGRGICPVCGKPISPQTTTCPHCKELIWEK